MATVFEELRLLIEQLSPDYQQRVLEYAQEHQMLPLTHFPLPPGTPGSTLLRFTLPLEDVEAIERALEDCEGVTA